MDISVEKLVCEETLQKFEIYERLLQEWNRRTALVQENTLLVFEQRHLLDSLQLIPIINSFSPCASLSLIDRDGSTSFLPSFEPPLRENWKTLDQESQIKSQLSIIDVGTGAGFPGMVLAMCGFKRVVLCESNQKKCFFLKEVARQTNTNVEVIHGRVENIKKKFDVVVARAFADLESLLGIMAVLLAHPSSYGLFHKGRSWQEELMSARKKWDFLSSLTQSVTSTEGMILCIHHLRKKEIV